MKILFTPESEDFLNSTKTYQSIWEREGKKIIDEFKNVTGLDFKNEEINVIVYEGVSSSGNDNEPMRLRASYEDDIKLGTLIHELGHRLLIPLKNRIEELDEHRTLFTFLYDVWLNLYGVEFADKLVHEESKRKGLYDYESAWNWAKIKTKEERLSLLEEVKSLN